MRKKTFRSAESFSWKKAFVVQVKVEQKTFIESDKEDYESSNFRRSCFT